MKDYSEHELYTAANCTAEDVFFEGYGKTVTAKEVLPAIMTYVREVCDDAEQKGIPFAWDNMMDAYAMTYLNYVKLSFPSDLQVNVSTATDRYEHFSIEDFYAKLTAEREA